MQAPFSILKLWMKKRAAQVGFTAAFHARARGSAPGYGGLK